MAADTEQVIVFDIGSEKFGIKITRVHEIVRMKEITELPNSSKYMEGIINLRGDIVSVIDLRKRFNLEQIESTNDTRIIVVEFEGQDVGVVVDNVSEVLHIQNSDVDLPPKSMAGIKEDYLKGIVKVDEDIIILLNLDNLLSSKENIQLENENK
ncbi:chemotaxis protein CheW [Natroniella sulfidigena]|uniref:chemotaxis protein CheW n=1 Tax=Natroniella sulfidigena TaxID=723921 RepID=UPI00200A572D|nr:chemotaxis protein CheW [Natroniella sulfidigena]MCK8818186.1 chemotaxis protein CheW [Natroniella sulfidigena]